MSLVGSLKYHANVTVLGKTFLRLDRMKLQRKMSKPGFWKHDHLGPPLGTSPRLKELISRHYLKGRYADFRQPVAWVTSGAPVEFLVALGYYVMYPENHGAVCGIRRTAEDLCGEAEAAGYSRDLCSYARTDIGAALSGKTPVGRLPKPTILVCCTNICQTVLYWYRVLAHHFGCPLLLIDTPFVYDEASEHSLAYVQKQVEQAVEGAERAAGVTMDMARLKQVTRRAKDAVELWAQVMACGQAKPAPITAFDEFIHMAPIVEMRGEAYTVEYYAALLAELKERIARGEGALKTESKRVLWDNLPIWHRVRWLSEELSQRQIALVASTYTNAWGELAPLIDVERPMESAARVHIHAILNRGTGDKLNTMSRMADEFDADGVILHSDRSCKPYSIGQIDQRERLGTVAGLPALLLEADHSDPRAFSEEQIRGRIAAFAEMLEG
jgi:benzoyl-CoA reductase/2-hydroxyglutaryl-CoA dehydratase subunit BcrC/BadD/HgdB